MSSISSSETAPLHQALVRGLRDLGWIEGKNINIEYRYAEGSNSRLADIAAELVRLKVDVIVASVQNDAAAAQKATTTIPIVVATAGDPVITGLVKSLARPGGNITGLSQMTSELNGKRLELLKEMVPKLSHVAVLWNPQGVASPLYWKEIQNPARQLGIQLHSLEVRSPKDFDGGFEAAAKARVGALFVAADSIFVANLKPIAGLAAKYRLPSIFQWSEFADAGGLVTYGPDRIDMFRHAAIYVDKILNGAKPRDLPIDRATKFEMVVNLRTAKALGLTIPQVVMVRATRVIE